MGPVLVEEALVHMGVEFTQGSVKASKGPCACRLVLIVRTVDWALLPAEQGRRDWDGLGVPWVYEALGIRPGTYFMVVRDLLVPFSVPYFHQTL